MTRIELWPHGAPNAQTDTAADKPFMDYFAAKNPNGAAVLVCPGGGYGFLAVDHEGEQIARWLNARGVAAFVLNYRIVYHEIGQNPIYPSPQLDAQCALRLIRARAAAFGLRQNSIGIWGFSAGGHLAATCATLFDREEFRAIEYSNDETNGVSARPDFAVLCYPFITMCEPWMHEGSRDNLIGKNAPPELAQWMSPDLQISSQTPPTFLFHTGEDDVLAENSLAFYQAMRANNVAGELHIYERGAHGLGLAQDAAYLRDWPNALELWLQHHITTEK